MISGIIAMKIWLRILLIVTFLSVGNACVVDKVDHFCGEPVAYKLVGTWALENRKNFKIMLKGPNERCKKISHFSGDGYWKVEHGKLVFINDGDPVLLKKYGVVIEEFEIIKITENELIIKGYNSNVKYIRVD